MRYESHACRAADAGRRGRAAAAASAAALVLGLALALAPTGSAGGQNLESTCGDTRNDFGLADSLYDAINDNGDGRIGPRRLVVNQTGRIVSRGTRLFVQATPLDTNRVRLTLRKTAGRARTTVTICATEDGDTAEQRVLAQFDVPRGQGSFTFSRLLTGVKDDRLSVFLKGRSLTDTMRYEILLERPNAGQIWEPTAAQLRSRPRSPIVGFADIHNHHASRWAFGGGWYVGEMDGPPQPDPPGHGLELSVNLPPFGTFVLREAHTNADFPAWDDTSHNQMGFEALRSAHQNGLRLIVSSAVNSEWFCAVMKAGNLGSRQLTCNDMESAKHQIRAMKQFDAAHDWYQIVTNPWEAREAIAFGRLAVVLGVEVSNLMPTSDGDWRRQLDELYAMGVRQIYLAHESNSLFAGAAYHHTETLKFPNQLTAWFSSEIEYASTNAGFNAIGLTSRGQELVQEMIRRHMLIDIDHISWRAAARVAQLSAQNGFYPLYAGHTRIEELLNPVHRDIVKELSTPDTVFEYIRRSGGMIGLRTGPELIEQYDGSGVVENCAGSVTSLAQTYRNAVDRGVGVAFGTDLNGFVTMTGPRFGPDACPDAPSLIRDAQRLAQVAPPLAGRPASWPLYEQRGLADISTLPSVVFDLQFLGADTTALQSSAEAFIRMWERTYRADRQIIVP